MSVFDDILLQADFGAYELDVHETGMTLRDYFAAQVLAGMLSSSAWRSTGPGTCASAAYVFADAMLKARGQTS